MEEKQQKLVSPEANIDSKKVGRPRGANKTRIQLAKDLCERLNVDPLEALLRIVKNRRAPLAVRVDAAKAACPFVYPKLSAVAIQVKDDNKARFENALLAVMSNPKSLKHAQELSLALTDNMRDEATNEPATLPVPSKDGAVIDAEFVDVPEPEPKT